MVSELVLSEACSVIVEPAFVMIPVTRVTLAPVKAMVCAAPGEKRQELASFVPVRVRATVPSL